MIPLEYTLSTKQTKGNFALFMDAFSYAHPIMLLLISLPNVTTLLFVQITDASFLEATVAGTLITQYPSSPQRTRVVFMLLRAAIAGSWLSCTTLMSPHAMFLGSSEVS